MSLSVEDRAVLERAIILIEEEGWRQPYGSDDGYCFTRASIKPI